MHSIIYSLYMRLQLYIILVVFCTGLKVNVIRITLHGGGLKYVKNSIGSNWTEYVFVSSYWFYRINLACACPLFLFHGTLFSFIINLGPCQTGNIILSPYQAGT